MLNVCLIIEEGLDACSMVDLYEKQGWMNFSTQSIRYLSQSMMNKRYFSKTVINLNNYDQIIVAIALSIHMRSEKTHVFVIFRLVF